jgi:hypothetical protein
LDALSSRHRAVADEIHSLEGVDRNTTDLMEKLRKLQAETAKTNPWAKDDEETDSLLKVKKATSQTQC